MDTPTLSKEQQSLLLSILWALTMTLSCLAIHRCFHAYLNSRRSEPLDHATLIAILLRELENLEKQVEREFQEPSQLVIQSRDSLLSSILPRFDDIEQRLEQVGADTLELRRRIIRLHDKVLSMSSELREMHSAQCTLTPERRQIYMCAEESKTAAGEEGGCCHQELEGA
ncbi:hypothetical protein CFD26_100773 [Aspergillus turcosus]|uniref:Uncharacterized protein n=1 Tax=Aspergillus turcosus TaxID=1245748 RepID=A0A421CUE0_9EURO|nr:hypothetical protein CFD26_100773 [Aspergillus turcosus]